MLYIEYKKYTIYRRKLLYIELYVRILIIILVITYLYYYYYYYITIIII